MIPLEGLEVPRLTDNAVCCPECGQRVTYPKADGLTERHDTAGGLECPAAFPPYVTATKTGPTAWPLHAQLSLVEPR